MKNIYFTDVAIKITIYSILFIIILITYINAIKKEENKAQKKNITIKFIIIQLILLVTINYLELSKYLSFQSIDDAYHFQYPNGKILRRMKYNNTTFVYGTKNYTSEEKYITPSIFTYYVKDSKWKIGETESYEISKTKTITIDNHKIYIDICTDNKNNTTGIFIYDQELPDNIIFNKNINITDKYKSKISFFDATPPATLATGVVVYFGIVEGKLDKDYYLTIEGEKFYLFK